MHINITAMIKDGGSQIVKVTPHMLRKLAVAIQQKGSEIIHMQSGSAEVVGFLVQGSQVGERVIILGKGDPQ
ncbi:hypothetical protein DFQ01_103205 [Paenibacillus cellulosilyticus]|uniref:Uncharacterized protein n=1 Tax=Paenibacillus cellulosilyticus TaxID=375489 RepID=A0A2V2YXD4_9BACL|nr:hypothetical protein [Paenibacillus cellulosilyticus]PWW06303.1 hypothetical protein DFQ01_103205 [Paenibacillus cellulosilyticus]QKS42951.1 hypothetical protein HUB94_00170 [Paenibacillus cellulosilyticus]QKS43474.1 hypothetical protein HUB94_02835 [Paenibacillus cellulosilyticus]QKS46335.1 hypothetical protein HUB94_19200 [Paenibacillus cellulosilyticus]